MIVSAGCLSGHYGMLLFGHCRETGSSLSLEN